MNELGLRILYSSLRRSSLPFSVFIVCSILTNHLATNASLRFSYPPPHHLCLCPAFIIAWVGIVRVGIVLGETRVGKPA